MRDRHFSRLCLSCQAPMARQEDSCWRCGAQWATEDAPLTTLRVIAGGRAERPSAELALAEARLQADRWTNEGGSVGAEPAAAPLAAVTARR
jgi:hypothetical protein